MSPGVTVPLSPRDAPAIIVGADRGQRRRGAWRGFALSDAGARISLVGRNPDRVRALAKSAAPSPCCASNSKTRHFDALVHATPLGMFPNVNECFFDGMIPAEIVFDMVYNPLETELIQRAREQGKTVSAGCKCSSSRPCGSSRSGPARTAPRAVMEKAALEALEQ